jgi:hypothetical protein
VAEATANAVGAELALRMLLLKAIEDRTYLGRNGNLNHIDSCRIA